MQSHTPATSPPGSSNGSTPNGDIRTTAEGTNCNESVSATPSEVNSNRVVAQAPIAVRTGDLPRDLLDSELLPKYKRDLVTKQKSLRTELQALQPQSGHCRLEVSRTEIFEVSNHK